jgi:hypothetical protein
MSRDERRDRICGSATAPPCVRSVLLGFEHQLILVSEASSHSARLAEICQALFGAALDRRYIVRGKGLYLEQDVTNRKEIN